MLDKRNFNTVMTKVTKLAGYTINEDSVKQILTLLGVDPTEQLIKETIGYLSMNSMQFTMANIHQFLQTKNIMSSKDLRKK